MHKSGLLKKKKRVQGEFSLQITSMADIFMILLVFLLKNYATSITNIAPTAQMALPEVTAAQGVPKDSLKIEISRSGVTVDDKPAVALKDFGFLPEEIALGESSPTISGLLKSERKKTPDPNLDSALVVMADEGTPYATIKRVIASAASAGFVDLQLLVVQTQ